MNNAIDEPKGRATVLVVDDALDSLSSIGAILRDMYRVKIAVTGEKALRIASELPLPNHHA